MKDDWSKRLIVVPRPLDHLPKKLVNTNKYCITVIQMFHRKSSIGI